VIRRLSLLASAALVVAAAGAGCASDNALCTSTGTGSECAARSMSACLPEEGCNWELGCAAIDCYAIETEAGCLAATVCNWSASICSNKINDPCAGLAEPACGEATGCEWAQSCKGEPVSCEDRSRSECETISHCWWEEVPSL
jgi:hypothetical protein